MDWYANTIFAQRLPSTSNTFPDGTPIRLGTPDDYPDAIWYRNRYGAIIPVLPGEKPPMGAVMLPGGKFPYPYPKSNAKTNPVLPNPAQQNLTLPKIGQAIRPIEISKETLLYISYVIAFIVLIVAINRSKKK